VNQMLWEVDPEVAKDSVVPSTTIPRIRLLRCVPLPVPSVAVAVAVDRLAQYGGCPQRGLDALDRDCILEEVEGDYKSDKRALRQGIVVALVD